MDEFSGRLVVHFLNLLYINYPIISDCATKNLDKGYAFVKLSTTFNQNRISNFETPTDGYNLLSAGLGSSFIFNKAKLGIHMSGTNLLDKTYISHLSRLKPEGIYNIGRNFNLGVSIQL